MPAAIAINGALPGSNESAVDLTVPPVPLVFDNSAAVVPTVNLWEFLEWPVGSSFNQTWLSTVHGDTGPIVTIPIPDMSGTWVVKYTDTNDGTTDTIICGIKNRRTSLRIPGAGETTESDNTIFPAGGAITNHRGWALTRDLGLKYLDDLVTSGAVQIFYLEDGTIPPTGINAGTPLALIQGDSEVLFPGTAPPPYNVPIRVPKVHLAQSAFPPPLPARYAYVGALKAGRSSSTGTMGTAATPSNTSYGYMTQGIISGTFVWVVTSGVVQGEAATGGLLNIATLDFTAGGWAVGDFVYLSGATPGALIQDTDTFAVPTTASGLTVPVGIVGDTTNAQGSMVVLPGRYQGNPVTNAKTDMFLGIGDYSSLRVGRSDGASVAGEEDGTIELCAIAGELIPVGAIVCISTNGGGVMQAFVADSSESPAIANNRKYGIFGVAVQPVGFGILGHFTIFGEANAITVVPAVGLLYVGSSSGGLGSTAGTATTLSLIDDTVPAGTYLDYPAIPIPLGVWDGTKLILGTTQDAGLVATVSSTERSSSPLPININEERNTTDLSFDKANVWRDRSAPSSTTLVDFPNTEADSLMMTTSVYEDTIKGSDLYDITNQFLGGKVWTTPPVGQVAQDMPGASINSGTWTGVGAVPAPRNEVYGTFVLEDARYFDQLIPVAFEVHGYTDNHTPGDMTLRLTARVNYRGNNTLGPFTTQNFGRITTGIVADTNSAFTVEYFSVTGTGNAFYVPKYDAAGGVFYSIDIILERIDVVNASLMVEKVVFQSLYLNKNISLNQGYPPVVFEKKVPGYTLINTLTGTFHVLDIGPAPGTGLITDPTVGASMSTGASATGLSQLVGFIPYDTRIQNAAFLNVTIIGKYTGTNVGAAAISLNFIYEELTAPNTYDPDITVAGVTLNDTYTPLGTAAAGDYEIQKFSFQIPNPSILASGIRFKIVRMGVALNLETSFQISNVYFETSAVTSYGVIEDVYEESTTATDVIDIDDALNLDVAIDFTGFSFPTPAAPSPESLFIPVKFDKRYNYRENINVEVFGYVTAASATDINLELAISNFYDHAALTPQTGALFTTIQRRAVDISAAGNVYLIKHTFVLAAKDMWSPPVSPSLSPYYTQFRDSGNSGLLLRLKRNDAAAVDYTTTNVRVYTRTGKKSSSEGLYVNLSEDITDPQNSYLEVKSAYRADRPYSNTHSAFLERNLLGSAHRYYFNYSIDDITIANGGPPAPVFPAGVGTALAARTYGCIVPFNMAIVGIYGFGDDGAGAGPVPAGVTIRLSLIDSAAAVLNTNSGVLHMPVDTVSLLSGWRWVANPLNFNIPGGTADFHEIPLIYLPSNYSSTGWVGGPLAAFGGPSWLLKCEAINNSGGSIDLTANITVEAILLPDFNVAD